MTRAGSFKRRLLRRTLLIAALVAVLIGFVAWFKLFRKVPQEFNASSREQYLREYFKYGSIGAEDREGMPYAIWLVLPRMFPEYLPQNPDGTPREGGYRAFGVAWEPGHETPVGFSKRTIGFPRIAINCALCHSATWRRTIDDEQELVLGGPSSTFDSLSYLRFLADCAADPRFNADNLLEQIEYNFELSPLDRFLYRHVIIPQTRKEMLAQRERYAWTYDHSRPLWGPGRIDPFNPVKFYQLEMEDDGTIGNSDMMSLWRLGERPGSLHWDGLNTDLIEVVNSGALGDGATNSSLPVARLQDIAEFIRTSPSPQNPFADRIDRELSQSGQGIFDRLCYDCHGAGGSRTGTVIPLAEIATDRHRADMWNAEAVERYSAYSDGYPWDFSHFVDEPGYVAVPLDGIWLRAPYLHNGSVPTLRDLLRPAEDRPATFYRGVDVLEPERVGFVHEESPLTIERGWLFDTSLPGNSPRGHEGAEFGTDLTDSQRAALLEYLKTL